MLQRLTASPLRLDRAYQSLEAKGAGAIVLFAGRVRPDATDRGRIRALEYEADRPLARRSFQEIDRQIRAQFPGLRLLLWHRTGRVGVGEIAVIVGAASPHRSAAFAATRDAIERLKSESPIWKGDRVRPARRPRRHRARRDGPEGG
jgi:molybdopterin synthase catalytic subunit